MLAEQPGSSSSMPASTVVGSGATVYPTPEQQEEQLLQQALQESAAEACVDEWLDETAAAASGPTRGGMHRAGRGGG